MASAVINCAIMDMASAAAALGPPSAASDLVWPNAILLAVLVRPFGALALASAAEYVEEDNVIVGVGGAVEFCEGVIEHVVETLGPHHP